MKSRLVSLVNGRRWSLLSFIYLTSSRRKQDKNKEVEINRQNAAVVKLDWVKQQILRQNPYHGRDSKWESPYKPQCGRKFTIWGFTIWTLHKTIFKKIKWRKIRWVRLVARTKATEIHTFGWKPQGKKQLRSSRIWWVHNIKMILRKLRVTVRFGFLWLRTGWGGEFLKAWQ